MNRLGSRNIHRVLTAILTIGNGQRISYERLAEVAGIAMPNTVAKATKEAEAKGLLVIQRGQGARAHGYKIPDSVEALL